MIRTWSVVSALAVALLFASTAEAQLNLRGLRFPAALQNVFMLRGGAVQEELGVSDEQKKQLEELSLQLQQEAFEIFSGLQDLTPEEQVEQMPVIMEMIAEKGAEVKDKVDNILDEEQQKRLVQLSLQARDAQALEDEEVVEALKLTDEQKKKLEAVREEGNEAMQKALAGLRGGGDQGDLRKKMGDMRKELSEKALAVLTPEQREQFDKMKGEAFEFPEGRGGFPF